MKKPGRQQRATIDFETKSLLDVRRVGPWLYSRHPTTEPLCLRYHVPGSPYAKPRLWHCAHPEIGVLESDPPWDLFAWIEAGGIVEAHNALFEFCIWNNICVPKKGWPVLKLKQLWCSAAKAAAHALPRSLEGACEALNVPIKKDPRGKYLINRYCKPRKLSKKERAHYGEDAVIFFVDDKIHELWDYCGTDVSAEINLSEAIPDLSPTERKVWRITQEMNLRGVCIDTELAAAALELNEKAKKDLNGQLAVLTEGEVTSGSKRAQVTAWLEAHENLTLPDTRAKTLEVLIDRDKTISDRARDVLRIMREVNRTSPTKYKRMLECVDPDDNRARDLLVYCGGERTGRYSGRGLQAHNLAKGRFPDALPKKEAMDIACADVKTRDYEWCKCIYGDVMNLITSCLRGAFIAPPGRKLITADYAAIEARCVLWEAGADSALNIFRTGGDIYCDMASAIYGYLIVKDQDALDRLREVDPERAAVARLPIVINSLGATQRDFGKVAVLGLGYGMGYIKFLITLRDYNIRLTREEVVQMMGKKRFAKYLDIVTRKMFPRKDDYEDETAWKKAERAARLERRKLVEAHEDPEAVLHELALCKYTVDTYRRQYPEVPQMWKDQERAAIQALKTGGPVTAGVVTWTYRGRYLRCKLPSGRSLHYAYPELKMVQTAWGEKRPGIRFMGLGENRKWMRQATYGGKLVENITQALARDVLVFAKIKIRGYSQLVQLVLSVHDEIIAECDEDFADEELFAGLMVNLPASMDGCPIAAEPKIMLRYRK